MITIPRPGPLRSLRESPVGLWAILLIAPWFFPCAATSQDVITIDGRPCGMHGSAKEKEAYTLNAFKNRYTAPRAGDLDTSITLRTLETSGDPNQFSPDKAVVLRGYVYNVKMGGVESCNCETKDPDLRDTHIELVPDEMHTGAPFRVIAEVTPRLRAIMRERGIDWSTAALRRSIKGRWVEVAGWLTYDVEHETAAYANDPDDVVGQRNWRATVWEVHPITYLKVIAEGQSSSLPTIVKEQAGYGSSDGIHSGQAEKGGHTGLWLAIGFGLVVVIGLMFLLNKKR